MGKRKASAVTASPGAKAKKQAKTGKAKAAKSQKSEEEKMPVPKILSQDELSAIIKQVSEQGNFNSIPTLLDQLDLVQSVLSASEDEKAETAGRHVAMGLYKVFQHLLSSSAMDMNHTGKELIRARWLFEKYARFQQQLMALLAKPLAFQSSLQLDGLDIYLALVKAQAAADSKFPMEMYQKLVQSLLFGKVGSILGDESSSNFILLEFVEKYFAKYWDLQCYFFDNALESRIEETGEDDNKNLIFSNLLSIIKDGLLYSSDEEELREERTWVRISLSDETYGSVFKARFQKCFFAVLRLVPLSASQYKALLSILHKRVMPYLGSPASLMDFLTDAFDQEEDAVVQILALNSLYELMKNYNLEYPDFYTKLYSMLTPQMLLTRYRSRFFRLCDLFLSSTHLAANLVASFIKKLARLSLTAAAPAVVIIIPFIYNVLKRHPTCMVLLQNTRHNDDSEYSDPFLLEENDPFKTNAMGSSLWELETLMSHYHPNVATLAKIFGEPFRKPNYNMEDFLDWSYMTLLESEKTRKYKGMASLEYEEYDSLFASDERSYISNWSL